MDRGGRHAERSGQLVDNEPPIRGRVVAAEPDVLVQEEEDGAAQIEVVVGTAAELAIERERRAPCRDAEHRSRRRPQMADDDVGGEDRDIVLVPEYDDL